MDYILKQVFQKAQEKIEPDEEPTVGHLENLVGPEGGEEGENLNERIHEVGDIVAEGMNDNVLNDEMANTARSVLESLLDEGDFNEVQREMATHHLEDILEQGMDDTGAIHYAREGYHHAISEYMEEGGSVESE